MSDDPDRWPGSEGDDPDERWRPEPEIPWTEEDDRWEEEGRYADTLPPEDPGPECLRCGATYADHYRDWVTGHRKGCGRYVGIVPAAIHSGDEPFDQDQQNQPGTAGPGGGADGAPEGRAVHAFGEGHVHVVPRDPAQGGRRPAAGGEGHHSARVGRGREPGQAPGSREVLALRIVPARPLDLAETAEWSAELSLDGETIHRSRPLPYRDALLHGVAVAEREAAVILFRLRQGVTAEPSGVMWEPDTVARY